MYKYNVYSFLYPSNSDLDELFDRIIKILYEHEQTLCAFRLNEVNLKSKDNESLLQEFMDKVAMGFKEDFNV